MHCHWCVECKEREYDRDNEKKPDGMMVRRGRNKFFEVEGCGSVRIVVYRESVTDGGLTMAAARFLEAPKSPLNRDSFARVGFSAAAFDCPPWRATAPCDARLW